MPETTCIQNPAQMMRVQALQRRQRQIARDTENSKIDDDTRADRHTHAEGMTGQKKPVGERRRGFANPDTESALFDRLQNQR